MATVSAEPRRRAPALCVVFLLALAGCNNAALDAASRQYQAERSYRSLVILHAALELGMPRDQVEGLLGPPEYSPIDGQVYYGSDARDESRDPPATIDRAGPRLSRLHGNGPRDAAVDPLRPDRGIAPGTRRARPPASS